MAATRQNLAKFLAKNVIDKSGSVALHQEVEWGQSSLRLTKPKAGGTLLLTLPLASLARA